MSAKTKNVQVLFDEWKKDPEWRAGYDALEDEFALAAAVIDARAKAGLTQAELAARMRTSQDRISNIEGGKANTTIAMLRRLAAATGTKLKISFEPAPKGQGS
ncbi:MAG: helix-turn-helix transcriptional regulator [Pseudomonadota bacterium]